MEVWNPWHGCRKISPGCMHCYMYRRDETVGKDSTIVTLTNNFRLPLMRYRDRRYKLSPENNPVYVCLTSDFFIEEADQWRDEAWRMIKYRRELSFVIITKRIERFNSCIPDNWGWGYQNVTIYSTCENQETADRRLPVLLNIDAIHKGIIHEPMLESIEISRYLMDGQIEKVVCGGESGPDARVCDYSWILNTRRQCVENNVSFSFKQTGARFRKDGRLYNIERKNQMEQAKKAGIDHIAVRE